RYDTQTLDHSDNLRRSRHRAYEFLEESLASSKFSYQTFQAFAALDIALHLTSRSPSRLPYPWRCSLAYAVFLLQVQLDHSIRFCGPSGSPVSSRQICICPSL